jgi:hypothetical protein
LTESSFRHQQTESSISYIEKLAEIQEELFALEETHFQQIKRKMKDFGIFSSKSDLKTMFRFIFATATKRSAHFELCAKLSVQLFIETQFSVKGFDLKEYASTYLFTELQKEKHIYRSTALMQFIWTIKAVGGFTSYHVASLIKIYIEKQLIGKDIIQNFSFRFMMNLISLQQKVYYHQFLNRSILHLIIFIKQDMI